jgi:hypothetical protein
MPIQRLARTAFPEREDRAPSAADAMALGLLSRLRRRLAPPSTREVARLAALLAERGPQLRALDDAALLARLRGLAPAAVRGRPCASCRWRRCARRWSPPPSWRGVRWVCCPTRPSCSAR